MIGFVISNVDTLICIIRPLQKLRNQPQPQQQQAPQVRFGPDKQAMTCPHCMSYITTNVKKGIGNWQCVFAGLICISWSTIG